MTEKKRKQHSAEYKFKVALEAAKENKTLSQLASEQEVHPNQISQWKRQLMEEGASLFKRNGKGQPGLAEEGQTKVDPFVKTVRASKIESLFSFL
jgi:transposase